MIVVIQMLNKNNENYVYDLVGKNIKKQRLVRGLTQQELADKANFSTQFISNIESKTYQTFSLATVSRLANILNIDISELFKNE